MTAFNLDIQSGSGLNIASEAPVATYIALAEGWISGRLLLSGLNGAAATITLKVQLLDSSSVKLGVPVSFSAAKDAAADTVFAACWGPIRVSSGQKLAVRAASSNASDTSVSFASAMDDAVASDVQAVNGASQTAGDLYATALQAAENASDAESAAGGAVENTETLITAVQNLNNLSALANMYAPTLMTIPNTGSTLYAFTLVVRDSEGNLIDLDASPTITAANAAGTDRSANLSAVAHAATGRYTFTYSVASTAAEESIRVTADGTASGSDRYVEQSISVVGVDTITTLLAVKSKTDLIATNAADSPNAVTAQSTIAANLDAAVSSRMQAFTLPANFATLSIDGSGAVTLPAAYNPAKTAAQPGDAMTLTTGERSTLAGVVIAAVSRFPSAQPDTTAMSVRPGSPALVNRGRVIEDSPATLLTRVYDAAGALITQAGVTGISVKVFDRDAATQIGDTLTPSAADVVSDALVTDDPRWTQDAVGYNFALTIPGACFPSGGTIFQVEVQITPTAGDPFYVLWELTPVTVFGD